MIPDLVIFDCDGVLVDTEGPTSQIIADNLTRHGLPLDVAEVDELFTGGTMNDVEDEARRRGTVLPTSWLNDIYEDIFARLAEGVDVIDGVFDVLDALDAAGVPHFIASNGLMRKMQITLTPSGLWDRFGDRILSREHYAAKPDPAMVLQALQRTNADPTRTFLVDDSTSGCGAGIAGGVRTIGFATEGQDAKLRALGATVVNSMAEVRQVILG